MGEDVGVGAAGLFEGVGEDGKAVEGAVGVERLNQVADRTGDRGGIERQGTERIAEDVTNQVALKIPTPRVPLLPLWSATSD